jgi:protein SCO1/2
MLTFALLSLTLLAGADSPPARLAVIQDAPSFTLTTHAEKRLSFADLKGKVLLVSFIFTTCSGSCPATTSRMVSVQQELARRGHLKDGRVHLLSITLDPARDTPEKLRDYAKLYDADTAHWTFLTGPADAVNKTVAGWGMWAKPAANGQLDHPSRIFLIDKQGRIREIYHLGFLKTAWVVEDMEALLQEK